MKKAEYKPKLPLEIDSVNLRCDEDAREYIRECELRYERDLAELCADIEQSGKRVVMVSGPSASGKTTSAEKISALCARDGRRSAVVSLDNFFKNIEDYPENEHGEKDYESPYALDIPLFSRCLGEILKTGECDIPVFDFPAQHRSDGIRHIDVSDGGILIVEGIHALNPILTDGNSGVLKLYAGLRCEYTMNDEPFLKTRDVRIIRRIIRDYLFRGFSAERTLGLWEQLQQGENKWIKVFKPDADLLLDTSFGYEACVYAGMAEKLFASPEHGGESRTVLEELLDKLRSFVPIEPAVVPPESMLREFMG